MFSTSQFCFRPTCQLCIFKQTWKIKNSPALEIGFPELCQSLLRKLLAFWHLFLPSPHQKSFCQHHIWGDKLRNSTPDTQYLTVLCPPLSSCLEVKKKKKSYHPLSQILSLCFFCSFSKNTSSESTWASKLGNYQRNKILPSLLSIWPHYSWCFHFRYLKCSPSSVPLEMYLFPYWMHYFREEKISSFNLWITLIFTLHLSFSLCFFHLCTFKLFLALHEAAKLEFWVCHYRYHHSFGAIWMKWSPSDSGHTETLFIFADSSDCTRELSKGCPSLLTLFFISIQHVVFSCSASMIQ